MAHDGDEAPTAPEGTEVLTPAQAAVATEEAAPGTAKAEAAAEAGGAGRYTGGTSGAYEDVTLKEQEGAAEEPLPPIKAAKNWWCMDHAWLWRRGGAPAAAPPPPPLALASVQGADPAATGEAGEVLEASSTAAPTPKPRGPSAWSGWSLDSWLAPAPVEPWAVEYVVMGRWLALVYYNFVEVAYTQGVHPFTGGQLLECEDEEDEAKPQEQGKPGAKPGARQGAKAGAKEAKEGGAAAGARAPLHLQRCFLDASTGVRDQLLQETQGMVRCAGWWFGWLVCVGGYTQHAGVLDTAGPPSFHATAPLPHPYSPMHTQHMLVAALTAVVAVNVLGSPSSHPLSLRRCPPPLLFRCWWPRSWRWWLST